MRSDTITQRIVVAVVLGHLVVSLVHGAAHSGAAIPMTLAANLFIWIVILAGPLAGLWMARSRPVAGGWVIAITMAGSLVFGVVNHFVIVSPDHVSVVAAEWRTLFEVTAVLLAVLEAVGVVSGIRTAAGGPKRAALRSS